MSILILATDIFSSGGIQQYTRDLWDALNQVEHIDEIYVASFLPPEGGKHSSDVDIVGKSRTILGKIYFGLKILSFVRNQNIDLILCNHVSLTPIAYLIKRVFKTQYIMFAYGIEIWGNLNYLRVLGLKRANAVISISQFTKRKLISRHRISEGKVFILPPSVDTKKFTPKRPKRELGLIQNLELANKKVILSVGRLAKEERYKGQDRVISALPKVLRRVPNVVYLIVGEGDDLYRLKKLAKKLGVKGKVIFTGYVNGDLIVDYYNACDVFVLPSEFGSRNGKYIGEGFGIVYLEASACSKPVIAGTEGGSAEAVINGETGFLVEPRDIDAIADAIVKLLTDEELAKRMGQKGRERALAEFSFESLKKDLSDTFHKIGVSS